MKRSWSIALLLLAGCSTCNSKEKEEARRKQLEAAQKMEQAKLAAKVTQDRATAPRIRLDDVIAEINQDPTAASTRYDGQLVKVEGKVAEKDPVKVIIHDGNGAASCSLPVAQMEKTNVGDAIAVTGFFAKGSGHVAVRLDSCEK